MATPITDSSSASPRHVTVGAESRCVEQHVTPCGTGCSENRPGRLSRKAPSLMAARSELRASAASGSAHADPRRAKLCNTLAGNESHSLRVSYA